MAGFFDSIGEFFTGAKQNKAEEAQKKAAQAQAAAAKEAAAQASQYGKGAQASMGANAAEYMQKAQQAAQAQATAQAQQQATAAAQQQLGAARTAGLNKGQAAQMAGQTAGQAYQGAYQQGVGQGVGQYMQGAGQFQQGQLGQQNVNLQGQQGAANIQSGIQQQQAAGATQAMGTGLGVLSGGLQAFGFSDERLKSGIVDSALARIKGAPKSPLEELVQKVRPVNFKYTPESGMDPSKQRVGVLAQDLEKTSMKDNVIDTPQGKMVDIPQQTLSNTNLIVQLAQEVYDLKAQLKSKEGK